MTFNEAILQIVEQNSGGVKITKLVSDMMTVLHGEEKQITDVQHDEIDFLEFFTDRLAELEAAGTIGILKYGFHMGDIVREKQFVYIPLESS